MLLFREKSHRIIIPNHECLKNKGNLTLHCFMLRQLQKLVVKSGMMDFVSRDTLMNLCQMVIMRFNDVTNICGDSHGQGWKLANIFFSNA